MKGICQHECHIWWNRDIFFTNKSLRKHKTKDVKFAATFFFVLPDWLDSLNMQLEGEKNSNIHKDKRLLVEGRTGWFKEDFPISTNQSCHQVRAFSFLHQLMNLLNINDFDLLLHECLDLYPVTCIYICLQCLSISTLPYFHIL